MKTQYIAREDGSIATVKVTRATEAAIHKMAPLYHGWAYVGLQQGQRCYTRGNATAKVLDSVITINNLLPIHYLKEGVWEAINQILDQVQENGPTDFKRVVAKFERRNSERQTVIDMQWSDGTVTSEVVTG